ncbi:septum formation initiator family protein [Anaerotignum sp.]|uniref:FtsB family cell division protein n=1 Tax=Anaerotignum sp. TaxID=2039241 RepID=UPI00331B230F
MDKIFIRVFLSVFICAVGVGVVSQAKAYDQIKQERMEIASQIKQEQEKQLEFEKRKEYYNSDSYIEQIAREQLGMVKPNEVLYINRGQ